jgi:hypothetical protein
MRTEGLLQCSQEPTKSQFNPVHTLKQTGENINSIAFSRDRWTGAWEPSRGNDDIRVTWPWKQNQPLQWHNAEIM